VSLAGSRPTTIEGAPPVTASTRRWGWAQYLALVGIPILILNVITVASWLADGPSPVTNTRSAVKQADWFVARAMESVAVLIAVVVIVFLIRECRRRRRLFTFDVMFCLAGATIFWADIGLNLFQPVLVVSSEWVNLNNTCGHVPFVVNPECGTTPDPILFLFLIETFALLGVAIVLGKLAERARRRWPDVSASKLFAILFGGGAAIVIFEPVVVMPLGGWNYPGNLPLSIPLGDGFYYPAWEMIAFGGLFGVLAALRFFRDDQGLTLAERGLRQYRPPVRTAVSMLAIYAVAQLAAWGSASAPFWIAGFHQQPWRNSSPRLVNGQCDVPNGTVPQLNTNTPYGPCPGSDGWRMPVAP
jgi:hypothetical protein